MEIVHIRGQVPREFFEWIKRHTNSVMDDRLKEMLEHVCINEM